MDGLGKDGFNGQALFRKKLKSFSKKRKKDLNTYNIKGEGILIIVEIYREKVILYYRRKRNKNGTRF